MNLIESGKLRPNDALPSDRELAKLAKCSLQPVMRAVQDLERRGILIRRPGAATLIGSTRPLLDDSAFSFSRASRNHPIKGLTTKVVELSRRPARKGPEWSHETQALRALGLSPRSDLLVIVRLRIFDGVPRVVHRSYLNPAHHDHAFLSTHSFADESLIAAFNSEGYSIKSRETVLTARMATPEEQTLLQIGSEAVLDVRQELHAGNRSAGGSLTIEYLAATYLHWEYRIQNRSSSGP